MTRIVEQELSYDIVGICFKVHKELNRFCREKQYGDRFEELLKENGIPYLREYEIKNLKDDSPEGNRVDFLIKGVLIVDFKAKPYITKEDYFQMQRYLNGANLELGIIINFRPYRLSSKRVLNSAYSAPSVAPNS